MNMLMHWEYLIAGRPRDHKDGMGMEAFQPNILR